MDVEALQTLEAVSQLSAFDAANTTHLPHSEQLSGRALRAHFTNRTKQQSDMRIGQ